MTEKSKFSFNFTPPPSKNISNPYVLLLGISKYKPEKWKDLLSVPYDINGMFNLFTKDFNYTYTFKNLNNIDTAYKSKSQNPNKIQKKIQIFG